MVLDVDYFARALAAEDVPTSALKPVHGAAATPYQVLRATTSVAELRAKGTFFTSTRMAKNLWANALETIREGAIIVDPTSGAGDLLLPVVETLRRLDGQSVLRVNDIDQRFTSIARRRLTDSLGESSAVAVEATNQDFLSDNSALVGATHVVLNPPYVNTNIARPWASGKVNAAAVFVEDAVAVMARGSILLAVLPDVLRSGSRYQAWRQTIERHGRIVAVESLGQFDASTDVDVFKLVIEVGASGKSLPWVDEHTGARIDDFFEVRVGPVVPHRDPELGPEVAYVTARSLSGGVELTRRFAGRLEEGPLVLINRTSRPGERPRIRARLHQGSGPLAVENHLLVAKPREGGSASCDDLLHLLASDDAVRFLDERIRCRHLTVRAIREIPWEAR